MLLSIQEAARQLGLKVTTLRCWRREGRELGPWLITTGARVHVDERDLKAYIQERRGAQGRAEAERNCGPFRG